MVFLAYYIDENERRLGPVILMEIFTHSRDAYRALGKVLMDFKRYDQVVKENIKIKDIDGLETDMLKDADDKDFRRIFRQYYIDKKEVLDYFQQICDDQSYDNGEFFC